MPSSKGNVLVVDDDPRVMNMISRALTNWGYSVSTAGNVEKARIIRDKMKPDLIIMDYRMSPTTGKEFLMGIRKRKDNTPIIMMSGYWTVDGWFEMKSLGAIDYLAKPLDYENLKQVVSRTLSSRP